MQNSQGVRKINTSHVNLVTFIWSVWVIDANFTCVTSIMTSVTLVADPPDSPLSIMTLGPLSQQWKKPSVTLAQVLYSPVLCVTWEYPHKILQTCKTWNKFHREEWKFFYGKFTKGSGREQGAEVQVLTLTYICLTDHELVRISPVV